MVNESGELVGVTECRLEPLQKGHVYMMHMSRGLLQEKARQQGAAGYKLHLIVTSHDGEIIPGKLRYQWAQKTFGGDPNIVVHSGHNSLEVLGYGNDYSGDRYTKDWDFWGEVATKMCGLGDTVDYFFGSEGYVDGIARACGAEPIEIDEDREAMRVSGTIMREHPHFKWEYFPDAVKPYFAKKVCITGAPFTGKADLVRNLAEDFSTVKVVDQSSKFYNPLERTCTRADLEKIAMLHQVTADALLEQANKVIICDSDALLTRLWYEKIFTDAPERIKELSNIQRFDLYVLTDSANMNFRESNTFKSADEWHAFTQTIKGALEERGWPYVTLDSHQKAKRHTNAVNAINDLRWITEGKNKMRWMQR